MYNKYKDELPENTIARIRSIYKRIGLTMDYTIEKHIDGIYSAYIQDSDGGWNTAGKGTTAEFCLASAYGESIEHICNHFAFDISKVSDGSKKHLGFLRYPDEKRMRISEVGKIAPDVYKDMMTCFDKNNNDSDLESVWHDILGSTETPFIPYFNITKKREVLLPDAILSKMCGSNGGGSGNTPEEAIGHALDEIIERYVKYKIIYDNLTPPTIPKQYILNRCPELYDLILNIEEKGQMSVLVKDASLGRGYTVICVIVIDKREQKYLANFGAHPCFEIALERCLTEMFQDHDCTDRLLKREEMVAWDRVPSDAIYGLNNWVSLLRDDIGALPDSLFGSHNSWDFTSWPVYSQYTNKFGMRYQICILQRNGFDVYIRNNSFLGFPVYKVYVPFASISHLKFDNSLVKETISANNIFEYLENGITKEEEHLLYKYCFNTNSFMLDMTLKNWDQEIKDLLNAAVLYDCGQLNDALLILKNTKILEGSFLKRYIQLTLEDVDNRDDLLRLFFDSRADLWLSALSSGNAFYLIQSCSQRNGLIKSLDSRYGISQKKRDAFYKKIKDAFLNNKIHQTEVGRIIFDDEF